MNNYQVENMESQKSPTDASIGGLANLAAELLESRSSAQPRAKASTNCNELVFTPLLASEHSGPQANDWSGPIGNGAKTESRTTEAASSMPRGLDKRSTESLVTDRNWKGSPTPAREGGSSTLKDTLRRDGGSSNPTPVGDTGVMPSEPNKSGRKPNEVALPDAASRIIAAALKPNGSLSRPIGEGTMPDAPTKPSEPTPKPKESAAKPNERTAKSDQPAPRPGERLHKPNDSSRDVAAPKAGEKAEVKAAEKAKPKAIEVGDGATDLSEFLGKGARLDRDTSSDSLRLSDGSTLSVIRNPRNLGPGEKASIIATDQSEKDPHSSKHRTSTMLNSDPFKVISLDGGRTRVQVGSTGHIDAISTKGRVYKFVTSKLD